jgi:hypothetical protein
VVLLLVAVVAVELLLQELTGVVQLLEMVAMALFLELLE